MGAFVVNELAIERHKIAAGMSMCGSSMVEGSGFNRMAELEREVAQLKREVALAEGTARFKASFKYEASQETSIAFLARRMFEYQF